MNRSGWPPLDLVTMPPPGARIGLPVLILGGAVGGLATWLWSRGQLPPTSMANHVEVNPPGHILKEPMPIPIQKMLEHADGIPVGPKGVIVQYNCKEWGRETPARGSAAMGAVTLTSP